MCVLVDNRTGSKDLHALLPRGYSQLTDLQFGDAVVVGNGPDGSVTEAFERKRLSDALSCMQNGRFAGHQLRGLRNDYDFVWLVIEDLIRAHPTNGILQRGQTVEARTKRGGGRTRSTVFESTVRWSDALFGAKSTIMWRDFMHWLYSMRRKGGVDDIVFTRNAQETADLIWSVHTWRQKPWSAHKSVDVFNRSADGKRSALLFKPPLVAEIAGRFKGVGWDKAMAIADRFKYPQAFMQATLEELMKIEGVGKKLAWSIVQQRNGVEK